MTINIPIPFNSEKINKFVKIIAGVILFVLFLLMFIPLILPPLILFEKSTILWVIVLIITLLIYLRPEIIKYFKHRDFYI